MAAIAFGRATRGKNFELACGFAFGGDFFTQGAASVGFAVKGLGHGSWASGVAKHKHFDFEITAIVSDAQHVPDVDFAGGLGGLIVALDSTELTGACGERSGFEEAAGPEIFVNSNRGHE